MENKNIIIILIVVIVILAAAIGVMLMNPATAKEATKIKITSDNEQHEGGELSIELTDLKNVSLSKQIVNITVTDSKGETVIDDVVKTDSEGKAKIDFDLDKGEYNVSVGYGGNENYTGNSTTQKLTIKEEEVVETAPEDSQTTNHDSNYNDEEKVDYNSRDSDYYKSDVDGSYHKKQEGANYIYTQDAVTGEWSYWADKS